MWSKSYPVVISLPPLAVLFAVIAYFVYGQSLSAALAVFLLEWLWGLVLIATIIPFVGIFVYWWLMHYIFNWVHSLTGLNWSWLLDIMFWIDIFIGALICIAFTVATLGIFGGVRRECRIDETGKKVCRWVWR